MEEIVQILSPIAFNLNGSFKPGAGGQAQGSGGGVAGGVGGAVLIFYKGT